MKASPKFKFQGSAEGHVLSREIHQPVIFRILLRSEQEYFNFRNLFTKKVILYKHLKNNCSL